MVIGSLSSLQFSLKHRSIYIQDAVVINLETPAQTHPEVCLLGDSISCRVVNIRDV